MNKLLPIFILFISLTLTVNTQAEQEIKMTPREKIKEHAFCVSFFTIMKMYIKPYDTEVRKQVDHAILTHTAQAYVYLEDEGVTGKYIEAFDMIVKKSLDMRLEYLGQNKISFADLSDKYLNKCIDTSFY